MRTGIIFGATVLIVTAPFVAAGPTNATKPGSGTSTGSAQGVHGQPGPVERRPVADRHEGLGRLRCPASEYADGRAAQPGWLRLPAAARGPTSRPSTGTPAYSDDEHVLLRPPRGPVRAGDGLLLGQPGAGVPPVARLRVDVSRRSSSSPSTCKINQYGGDNSYQTDKPFRIRLGKGGVDDAEDAEVIVHEYGHAVHQSQVPGFGSSIDAGAIGESFGDYLAVTVGPGRGRATTAGRCEAEEACPMDWDATSYTDAPHCIRRFDLNLTLADRQDEVHFDGQIWSQALWEIRQGYVALGLTHGGLGHHLHPFPVRLRAGHLVPGRRRDDVPGGTGPRRAGRG